MVIIGGGIGMEGVIAITKGPVQVNLQLMYSEAQSDPPAAWHAQNNNSQSVHGRGAGSVTGPVPIPILNAGTIPRSCATETGRLRIMPAD